MTYSNSMMPKKNESQGNEHFQIFVVCGITFLLSFFITKNTNGPEYKLERELQDSIASNELALFQAIKLEGIYDTAEISKLQRDSQGVRQLREDADETWESIPEGTVISRNGHSVGSAATVKELRRKADEKESELVEHQHEIAQQKGSLLRESDHIALWQEHTLLDNDIRANHDRNPKYYKTGWGKVVKILHSLFLVLCIASGGLTALMVLIFVLKIFGDG